MDDVPRTRAVVEEFLNRCAKGDPDEIAALYAEQVDWRVGRPVDTHPLVPWIRPRSTRAEVTDHYRTFAAHCVQGEGVVSIDQLLVDERDAVLFGTGSQQVVSTGERFTMVFALRLTVEDGLLTRHHMYEDSLAVVEAFSVSGRRGATRS